MCFIPICRSSWSVGLLLKFVPDYVCVVYARVFRTALTCCLIVFGWLVVLLRSIGCICFAGALHCCLILFVWFVVDDPQGPSKVALNLQNQIHNLL